MKFEISLIQIPYGYGYVVRNGGLFRVAPVALEHHRLLPDLFRRRIILINYTSIQLQLNLNVVPIACVPLYIFPSAYVYVHVSVWVYVNENYGIQFQFVSQKN